MRAQGPHSRREPVTRVATVVLAAGGSSRMGSPKQLLRIEGISLVRRVAETALASRCQGVYVVVGAEAGAVRREVSGLSLEVVDNPDWEMGLAGSIRVGVEAVQAARPEFDAAILAPVDQPRNPPRPPRPADRSLRGRRARDRRLHLRGNRRSTGAVLTPPLRGPHPLERRSGREVRPPSSRGRGGAGPLSGGRDRSGYARGLPEVPYREFPRCESLAARPLSLTPGDGIQR